MSYLSSRSLVRGFIGEDVRVTTNPLGLTVTVIVIREAVAFLLVRHLTSALVVYINPKRNMVVQSLSLVGFRSPEGNC
jgi:hypothetical protein